MAKTWKPWTTMEIKRLIELRNQGLLLREIAAIMGRTYSAIRDRCSIIELPKTRIIEKYLRLFEVPHQIEEVAQKMGVTQRSCRTIKNIIKNMGFDLAGAIIDKEKRYARFRKAS